MTIIAIDPGEEVSGIVMVSDIAEPITGHIWSNSNVEAMLNMGWPEVDTLLIETTRPYGAGAMPREVLETIYWSGRFACAWDLTHSQSAIRVDRRDVKLHLLGRANGNDAQVNAAVWDRYGGSRKKAVGRKAEPGPCYGFTSHVWAALALALTYVEMETASG